MLNQFSLSKKQIDLFYLYYEFLVSENEKYNLTAITNKEEVYIKHFEDSLSLSLFIDFQKQTELLDVGSGAGFPAIPLAILYPSLPITIVEPTLKKIHFLSEVIEKLNLKNVTLIAKRIEELNEEYRNRFSLVVARAVAPLAVLLELCIPFTKVKGVFCAMKSGNYEQEISDSQNAMLKLRAKVANIHKYELSQEMGSRTIIEILKTHETSPIYPRRYSQIKKNHL